MSIMANCSGSDRRGLGMEGLLARDSCWAVESLGCVLEQDTLSTA